MEPTFKSRFGEYPTNNEELSKCYSKWDSSGKILRFGQFMYNNYVQDGKPWPELFYCTDYNEAYNICFDELEKR